MKFSLYWMQCFLKAAFIKSNFFATPDFTSNLNYNLKEKNLQQFLSIVNISTSCLYFKYEVGFEC